MNKKGRQFYDFASQIDPRLRPKMMTKRAPNIQFHMKTRYDQLKDPVKYNTHENTSGNGVNYQTYQTWRAQKLANAPSDPLDVMVDIDNLAAPSKIELEKIHINCAKTNFSFYRTPTNRQANREHFMSFAAALGLSNTEAHRSAGDDGIVALELSSKKSQAGYIPYTNRRLSWHTDGYYNYHGPDHAIRAMALHCVRPAQSGGENAILDPDIAYIRMRDENPDFISAFMAEDAMTIPENRENNGKIRPTNTGPVFFIDGTGELNMRFTARTRNIQWKDDATTRQAVEFLGDVLTNDPLIIRNRLNAGEGIICNNVLHNRTGFDNSDPKISDRLLYRARYYQRVADPNQESDK